MKLRLSVAGTIVPAFYCSVLALLIACDTGGSGGGAGTPSFTANDDDLGTVMEGSQGVINVLSNDTISNPTIGSIKELVGITANPHLGTVAVSNESVTYLPNPGVYGDDTFTYQARSLSPQTGGGTLISSDTAIVRVRVIPVPGIIDAIDDGPLNVVHFDSPQIDVLANDTGDNLTIQSVSDPLASITDAGKSIRYFCSVTGSTSFTYTITNGTSFDTATVSLEVQPSFGAILVNNSNSVATFQIGGTTAVVQPLGRSFVRAPALGLAGATTVLVTVTQPPIVGSDGSNVFQATAAIGIDERKTITFDEFPTPMVTIY